MGKRRKFLTIEEKRELISKGESVPVCIAYSSYEEKAHKKEKRRLDAKFRKSLNG